MRNTERYLDLPDENENEGCQLDQEETELLVEILDTLYIEKGLTNEAHNLLKKLLACADYS